MAKLSLKDFSGGLNTRYRPNSIADNEAVEATDVSFDGVSLRSSNGVNSNQKSGSKGGGDGEYYYRGNWVSSKNATAYENFGDNVISTHDNSRPTITKLPAADNNPEPLGVPRRPSAKAVGSVISEGSTGDTNALAYPIIKIDAWDDEDAVEINSKNNNITFGSAKVTVDSTDKPFWDATAKTALFKIDDYVSIEIPGEGEGTNVLRFKVTGIDTTNYKFLDTESGTFETETATEGFYRFKRSNLVDGPNTSLKTMHTSLGSKGEESLIYTPTSVNAGDYMSYDPSVKKVTAYDYNHSNSTPSEILSPALTHSTNPRFFDDSLSAHSDDGASFIDLTNTNLPKDDIVFTAGEHTFVADTSTRTVNSTNHINNLYLASVETKGSLKHDSETIKTGVWLGAASKKKYLLFDVLGAIENGTLVRKDEGFVLHKKNADGIRKPVNIAWKVLGPDSTLPSEDPMSTDRDSSHPFYYALIELKKDEYAYLECNDSSAFVGNSKRLFDVGADSTVSTSYQGHNIQTYRNAEDIKTCVGPSWARKCWKWGETVTIHRRKFHELRLTCGDFTFHCRYAYENMVEKYDEIRGVKNMLIPGMWMPIVEDASKVWAGSQTGYGSHGVSTTLTGTEVSLQHTFSYPLTKDFVHSRIHTYVPHSNGSVGIVHPTAAIINKASVANGNNGSTVITLSGISDTTKYFTVGDSLTLSNSKFNDGTYIISAVSGGTVTVSTDLAIETNVMKLDTHVNHGTAVLNPEELFDSYYGVIRKEGEKSFLRGYSASNHAVQDGSLELTEKEIENSTIYGLESGGVPYFIVLNRETNKVSSLRANDTADPVTWSVGDHNYFDIQGDKIVVSGSSKGNKLEIYSVTSQKLYSGKGGKGADLGMYDHQITERAWFDNANDFIFVALRDKTMLMIKPDAGRFDGSESSASQSVMRAPFNHFLSYDPTNIRMYGALKSESGTFSKIQYTRPFFDSEVAEGEWVEEDVNSNAHKAKVAKLIRDAGTDRGRYLFLDYEATGANWTSTKGIKTWKFLLPGHTPGSPRIFKFDSKETTDIVLFGEGETNIPEDNAETDNDKLTFINNYDYVNNASISTYYYFVADKQALNLEPHVDSKGKQTEYKAVQLYNGNPETQSGYDGKFHTRGIGETQFVVSAPNMYDSSGAAVPFQYMIALVDKNGVEGAPSTPTDEIKGLDQATESIQVSMAPTFFSSVNFKNNIVEKIRVYRKGGNYSSFRFLFDRNIKSVLDGIKVVDGNDKKSYDFQEFTHDASTRNVKMFFVSSALDDPINAYIEVPYHDDNTLNSLEDYVGSDIDVSGFVGTDSTVGGKYNNGGMRVAKFEKQITVSGNDVTRIHVHALKDNEHSGAASPKGSRIAYTYNATTKLSETVSTGNITIAVSKFAFRDSLREPPITGMTPQLDAYPPIPIDGNGNRIPNKYFKFMKNVGGIFYSSCESSLRFSHFNNPHSWPLLGYVDLDSDITGIAEYMGEALVFTAGSLYRVRGSNPEAMTYVKLPESHGLTSEYAATLIEAAGRVFWMNPDGVCMYENGQVQLITFDKLGNIPSMHSPVSGYKDRVIYFFNTPHSPAKGESRVRRPGVKVDMSIGQPKISRVTVEATSTVYVPEDDVLYVNNTTYPKEAGAVEAGSPLPLSYKTKDFDFGDLNESTVLMGLEADIKSTDVTVKENAEVTGNQQARDFWTQKDHGNLGDSVEAAIDSYGIGADADKPFKDSDYDFGSITSTVGASQASNDESIVTVNTAGLAVGMYVWGTRIAAGTKIKSVANSTITLDQPALSTGKNTLYFGDLPRISLYKDEESQPFDTIYPFPGTGDFTSVDLYLNDYKRFRTLSLKFEGKLELRQLSMNAEPLSAFKKHTLYHSADISYSGDIKLVLTLDGKDVFIKSFNSGSDLEERRVYFPSNSVGTVPYFKNASHLGRISSLEFNAYPLRA